MKFVRVAIKISFEEVGERASEFEREFELFSSTDTNPVDDYIQKLKAKEGKNAPDDMLIFLLAELHKKVDELIKIVQGRTTAYVPLAFESQVDFAWYDTLKIDGLKSGAEYYARMELPLFRPRQIPLFFVAREDGVCKITKMWPTDRADFEGYLASKDREEVAREKAFR